MCYSRSHFIKKKNIIVCLVFISFYLVLHIIFSFVDNTFHFFFSTARGSVLKPEPGTIHKDISGMKIHSYVHCLLLTHFIFEICSTLVTPIIII